MPHTVLLRLSACALALLGLLAPARSAPAPQAQDQELERELEAERREADRLRRRGETAKALRSLSELLGEDPKDARSRFLRARVRADEADWEAARSDALRALKDAQELPAEQALEWRSEGLRDLAQLELSLGRAPAARELLVAHAAWLAPLEDPRDAWILARTAAALGEREVSRLRLAEGAAAASAASWQLLLARARCERALGLLEEASRSLVEADRLASAADGPEPDVLAELASVYFEADGEIEHPQAKGRAPGVLLRQALELHPRHEAANLGLFELNRFNWNRQSRSPNEILGELLRARPASVEGLLAGASSDLDDGQLVAAREKLARLSELAPGRRELRALGAALAWIEHREEDANREIEALLATDPGDSRPEREVGRTLCELYRFGEGLAFLERAVKRDPADPEAWTQLGRAQANTGNESAALASLTQATELAAGRQNAWRFNTAKVLERMRVNFLRLKRADHTYLWAPDAAAVLEAYLVPFYAQSRESLATRYGFTPGPVQIEVFERHRDFSVRSTGFEGFPALGVCFGPVVTSVSPVSELRGSFSWARTSFHEFTHVIHLGLSHNRCPRWITEGLATWEEVNRRPSWTRNMRRELLDARANGEVIGVRDLNRAFRGPRILFAYYQSGLWCQMMIERHGFPKLVHLLEAFDRGLDLDQALEQVFQTTPEEVDRQFAQFVDRELAPLRIEPRWSPTQLARLQLELGAKVPRAAEERARWIESTVNLAAGRWQTGARIDAEQALLRLGEARETHPRALFLRGEMALSTGNKPLARSLWQKGLELGGEDYRVRFALGRMAETDGEPEAAEAHFLAAEKAFPGYDEPELCAELSLAKLYAREERVDDQQAALARWLEWNSGEYPVRMQVAAWHAKAGRWKEAERLYSEANDVDPFRRKLHREWATALGKLARHAEALREYQVTALVPVELDLDKPEPLSDSERAELLGLEAGCLVELGRSGEALECIDRALQLDPDCESAKSARERLP